MSRYLEFVMFADTGKTKVWAVNSLRHGDMLGIIKWYGPWRQYAFFPQPETLFNRECMGDICIFIERAMGERRPARAAREGKDADG